MLLLGFVPSLQNLNTSLAPTNSRGQQTKETVFTVNGATLTHKQCEDVVPEQRTVAHWQVLLDWERQRSQPYVIVDPFDPSGLLYFSEVEYKIQARTLGSMNTPFIVVARPGSKKPVPQNSPLPKLGGGPFLRTFDPITWREMKRLRSFIARNVKWSKTGVVRVNDRNIMGLVWMWTRELFHYLDVNSWSRRQGQFLDFVRHFQNILRRNGSTFAIQRLKISLFALYSWLGGNPLHSTQELGQRIRLRGGLPVWMARKALRDSKSQGLKSVRVWASVLNIYKYIEGKHGTPPLDTIRAPSFKGDVSTFADFVQRWDGFICKLRVLLDDLHPFKYESASGLTITSAGVNHPLAMMSLPADAYAWLHSKPNWVLRWFEHFKDEKMVELLHLSASKYDPSCRRDGDECEFCLCTPRLGRLHPIEEAAGKVRVVAICDYFTQVALKPVHDYLFSVLRKLPTDATFDQQGAVDRFAAKGFKEIYSYDLKAATDLIPIQLYRIVMEELFKFGSLMDSGYKPGFLWEMILTDREFVAPIDRFDTDNDDFLVRYGRGQPMGALSSWASLALVHHALVQMAADEAGLTGPEWFSDYLVLGDDIVIANKQVAESYLDICSRFEIKVGLAKSLVSEKGLMNFANQTLLNQENVSPLSLREELSAQNIPMRKLLAERIHHRWGGDSSEIKKLKRILTEPQWSALTDGGIRGSGALNLNLVRFLVENPFLSEETEVTTRNVLSWLGFVDPELRKLPSGLVQDLDEVLRVQTLNDLCSELERRMSASTDFLNKGRLYLGCQMESYWGYRALPDRPGALPPVVHISPEGDAQYLRPGEPALKVFGLSDKTYLKYLFDCLSSSIERSVDSVHKELLRKLMPFRLRVFLEVGVKPVLPEGFPTLDWIIKIHKELISTPNPKFTQGANLEENLFSLFKALPDGGLHPDKRKKEPLKWTKVREVLVGPMGSLSKALGRVLGIKFPVHHLLNESPSPLWKALRRLQREVIESWCVRDASPCQAPPGMDIVPLGSPVVKLEVPRGYPKSDWTYGPPDIEVGIVGQETYVAPPMPKHILRGEHPTEGMDHWDNLVWTAPEDSVTHYGITYHLSTPIGPAGWTRPQPHAFRREGETRLFPPPSTPQPASGWIHPDLLSPGSPQPIRPPPEKTQLEILKEEFVASMKEQSEDVGLSKWGYDPGIAERCPRRKDFACSCEDKRCLDHERGWKYPRRKWQS